MINSLGELTAEVIDDGSGFAAGNLPEPTDFILGYGLFDIKEKINHLGGVVDIWSSPGYGTQVRMTIPLS